MQRSIDMQWILDHTEVVKNVITEVVSEETQSEIAELQDTINTAVELVFDILYEPLLILGIKLPRSRGLGTVFGKRLKALALKKLAELADEALTVIDE